MKKVKILAKKERLDVVLVEKGLCSSREKAKKMIMAGLVFVDHQREDKAGTMIDPDKEILVKEDPNPYVSRGGLKLHKAVKKYDIDLENKICMDIGASTGGFTDCMLQHGAKKVYSVDVGYGQLDWKLRSDERVVCLEKTNVRYITKEQVPDLLDFVSVDVSFISLLKVLPAVLPLMTGTTQMVCLIKPQFEAGRENIGKKGVVKDPKVHEEVIIKVTEAILELGFSLQALDYSPITGPEGNIEFLFYGEQLDGEQMIEPVIEEGNLEMVAKEIVHNAHRDLYGM